MLKFQVTLVYIAFVSTYSVVGSLKVKYKYSNHNLIPITDTINQVFNNCLSLVVISTNSTVARFYVPHVELPLEVFDIQFIMQRCSNLPFKNSTLTGFILVVHTFDSVILEHCF